MDATWKTKLLVAAIDFGTTFSGFALSFISDYKKDKTAILTNLWKSGDQLSTHKTPTCLLLKPDMTFHSFGSNAEKKYADLVEYEDHKRWHFFRRFKMRLYQPNDKNVCGLSAQSKISDTEGRVFDAMTVFSYSIQYMKTIIIEVVREKFPDVRENDIYYVLTTPAIWSEQAKLFMRNAARNAHIPDKRLRIALEPECAAVYVYTKEFPAIDAMSRDRRAMKIGTCHLIIDLGGGTIDIAAHRVTGDCQFEEIIAPDNGAWGWDNINMKFEQFLLKITGGPAFAKFKAEHVDDYLRIQRSFENKICAFIDENDEGKVTLVVPESFRKLHEEHNRENPAQSVRRMSYAEDVEFKADKMRLKTKLFRSFFSETVDGVIGTVEKVLAKIPEKIDTIICVGGFADYGILKKAFRDKFPNKTVIIPQEAVTAIMKGAIIYCRDRSVVNERIRSHTYGLSWDEDIDLQVHDETKREETEDGQVCRDIFRKCAEVEKGETAPFHKPTQETDADVKSKNHTIDTTWKTKLLVAAIDFGTTFSGFALSFLGNYENDKAANIITCTWKQGDKPSTHKTPTCLLLDPNESFSSFGYDAEEKYAELAEAEEHKEWHFFRRFKMKLYKPGDRNMCGLSFQSKIKDTEGRDFDAMTVFSYSVEYMKRKIIKVVKDKAPDIRENDIYYVLTTPAIWSEQAKLFMRKAAGNAHIPNERLRIALEPECASVYVHTKELPALDKMSRDQTKTKTESCHLIIDLGGGTLDIAAYRVIGDCQFEEIIAPEGGAWGADKINMKYEQFLLKLTGGPAFEQFKEENMEDYLIMQRDFEHKKCAFIDKGDDGQVTLRLPESFRNLHKEHNRETLSESLRETNYSQQIIFRNEKMRLKTKLFRSFFTETVDGVLKTVEKVLANTPEKIDTIVCVGGFSDCELLKTAIRDKFPNKRVIIPEEAATSIMKGAVIFGRDQSVVNKRISRHTYGLDWNEDFDPMFHDQTKREETEDGHVCRDIFKKLIEKGETVPFDKPTQEINAYVKSKYQTVIDFPFYRSEIKTCPRYIDEMGCHLMGTMRVNLGQNRSLDRCVKLKVYFGATELKAEAEDDTGKKYEVTFNLEETQV